MKRPLLSSHRSLLHSSALCWQACLIRTCPHGCLLPCCRDVLLQLHDRQTCNACDMPQMPKLWLGVDAATCPSMLVSFGLVAISLDFVTSYGQSDPSQPAYL